MVCLVMNMNHERLRDGAWIRWTEEGFAIFLVGAADQSPNYGTGSMNYGPYPYDPKCGYCWLGQNHSVNAHCREVVDLDSERCPRCGKYGADGHTLACDYLEGE